MVWLEQGFVRTMIGPGMKSELAGGTTSMDLDKKMCRGRWAWSWVQARAGPKHFLQIWCDEVPDASRKSGGSADSLSISRPLKDTRPEWLHLLLPSLKF